MKEKEERQRGKGGEGNRWIEGGVKQRESPKSRRKQEWRRVTPVGTSSFDIVCSSRRSRNYPSIAKRDALVSLSWLLFRSFFSSAATRPSFHGICFFRCIARTSRWTRSHPLDRLRDYAALLSTIRRVICRLSSGSFAVIICGGYIELTCDADAFKSLCLSDAFKYRYEFRKFLIS